MVTPPLSSPPPLSRRTAATAALTAYIALTLALLWPLPLYLSTRIAHDPGDPLLNTWLLWWNAQVIPFTAAWWNPPFFYPMHGALALSEHLLGISVLTNPILWAGGSPPLAYNVALVLSYVLSAFFTFLLVRRLTGSDAAAFCAGLAFGFAPYRAGQLAHLQVLSAQWLPLQLLGLHAYLTDGRRRWLVLFGVAWILQGLANGYYLLFTPVLVGLWLLWFVNWRSEWRRGATLVAVWMAASLPLVPVLLKYREVHASLGLARTAGEIQRFSAEWTSLLNAHDLLRFWPARDVHTTEDFLFPGLTVVAVIITGIAVTRRRGVSAMTSRRALLFYVLAAVFLFLLTMGPGRDDGGVTRWVRPYTWLQLLPGYAALRVPSRFAMLSTLCVSVAAGLAFARFEPRARTKRLAVAAVVSVGLLIDGWIDPLPVVGAPGRAMLPPTGPAAVIEVPADETYVSVSAMYRAIFHRYPLINGYSGHVPPHFKILTLGLRRFDPSGIIELARGRTLIIIVHQRFDEDRHFRSQIEQLPGIQTHGATAAGAVYVLPAQPRERIAEGGTPLSFTTHHLPREHVVLDLGEEKTVRTLSFPLQWRYMEFGERFAVEVSQDGTNWTMQWLGGTAGPAVAGALEDQLLVPVRIPLRDVRTRYLRIHPAPPWLVSGLTLRAP